METSRARTVSFLASTVRPQPKLVSRKAHSGFPCKPFHHNRPLRDVCKEARSPCRLHEEQLLRIIDKTFHIGEPREDAGPKRYDAKITLKRERHGRTLKHQSLFSILRTRQPLCYSAMHNEVRATQLLQEVAISMTSVVSSASGNLPWRDSRALRSPPHPPENSPWDRRSTSFCICCTQSYICVDEPYRQSPKPSCSATRGPQPCIALGKMIDVSGHGCLHVRRPRFGRTAALETLQANTWLQRKVEAASWEA